MFSAVAEVEMEMKTETKFRPVVESVAVDMTDETGTARMIPPPPYFNLEHARELSGFRLGVSFSFCF